MMMYSDEWNRQGCISEDPVKVSDKIYYRHTYDQNGTLLGVTVDYEYADNYHYELTAENWDLFCREYLREDNELQAFKSFIDRYEPGSFERKFSFENALNASGIEYQKIPFY